MTDMLSLRDAMALLQHQERRESAGSFVAGPLRATRKLTNYQVFVQDAMRVKGMSMKEAAAQWRTLTVAEKAAFVDPTPLEKAV